MTGGKRRFQIYLQSESGIPIDVYVVSQEIEDASGESALMGSIEDQGLLSPVRIMSPRRDMHPAASPTHFGDHEHGSILRLGSPITVDPDYYLNNMYQTEGISDFYSDGKSSPFFKTDSAESSFVEEDLLSEKVQIS